MKIRFLTLALSLTLGAALPAVTFLTGCGKEAGSRAGVAKYHCPMHPTVISDKPGDCPICGMRLVPMDDQKQSEKSSSSSKTAAKYHCPMHPTIVSDKKGSCPICGMDLVPIEEEPAGGEGDKSSVTGLAAVSIAPEIRQRIGLTIGAVEKRKLDREIRTSARIVADETRLYHVTTKIDGWVEKLFTATTGQYIKQGDPMFSIYSPDLVAAQEELLTALRLGTTELAMASRRRLSLWDVSDEQIDRLIKTREIEKIVTFYAPVSGSLMERRFSAGHKVMAGEELLAIADLSSVWADADIYQSDLARVEVGMTAQLSLPYWPEKSFEGKVTFLSASLDPTSRTLTARMEVPNPGLLLKPDMYAEAHLAYSLGEGLAIPESAVMRTGEHVYAFKDAGEGRLIPTKIKIGSRGDGYFQLLEGLAEGDKVVTSANFLVDSESSLKAALGAMSKEGESSAEAPPAGGHRH